MKIKDLLLTECKGVGLTLGEILSAVAISVWGCIIIYVSALIG